MRRWSSRVSFWIFVWPLLLQTACLPPPQTQPCRVPRCIQELLASRLPTMQTGKPREDHQTGIVEKWLIRAIFLAQRAVCAELGLTHTARRKIPFHLCLNGGEYRKKKDYRAVRPHFMLHFLILQQQFLTDSAFQFYPLSATAEPLKISPLCVVCEHRNVTATSAKNLSQSCSVEHCHQHNFLEY